MVTGALDPYSLTSLLILYREVARKIYQRMDRISDRNDESSRNLQNKRHAVKVDVSPNLDLIVASRLPVAGNKHWIIFRD
jgi:hypothetical protein